MAEVLKIDLFSDLFLVYFMFHCKAKDNQSLTANEYANGLRAFGVSSIKSIK